MKKKSLPLIERIKLKLGGQKYYLTRLLPIAVYKRYGLENGYSENQLKATSEFLGYEEYYDEEIAKALLGNAKKFGNDKKYFEIRKRYGLIEDGPREVFWVYSKMEKFNPDPMGVDRAAETTGGLDGHI